MLHIAGASASDPRQRRMTPASSRACVVDGLRRRLGRGEARAPSAAPLLAADAAQTSVNTLAMFLPRLGGGGAFVPRQGGGGRRHIGDALSLPYVKSLVFGRISPHSSATIAPFALKMRGLYPTNVDIRTKVHYLRFIRIVDFGPHSPSEEFAAVNFWCKASGYFSLSNLLGNTSQRTNVSFLRSVRASQEKNFPANKLS